VKWDVTRLRGYAVLVVGILFICWGTQHFYDPIAVHDYHGVPLPGKDQYVYLLFGAISIVTGTTYLSQRR
jgi:hypothetical protein